MRYRVLKGFNYPDVAARAAAAPKDLQGKRAEKRVEPSEEAVELPEDLPGSALEALLAAGALAPEELGEDQDDVSGTDGGESPASQEE